MSIPQNELILGTRLILSPETDAATPSALDRTDIHSTHLARAVKALAAREGVVLAEVGR